MAKGEKFVALTVYLEKCNQDSIKMTFKQIESILGDSLPESAYTYPALWSNSESHSIAFGWLNAGYLSRNVSIPNQTIEFVKTGATIQRSETSEKKRWRCAPKSHP